MAVASFELGGFEDFQAHRDIHLLVLLDDLADGDDLDAVVVASHQLVEVGSGFFGFRGYALGWQVEGNEDAQSSGEAADKQTAQLLH